MVVPLLVFGGAKFRCSCRSTYRIVSSHISVTVPPGDVLQISVLFHRAFMSRCPPDES
jgi:hypothetical protein